MASVYRVASMLHSVRTATSHLSTTCQLQLYVLLALRTAWKQVQLTTFAASMARSRFSAVRGGGEMCDTHTDRFCESPPWSPQLSPISSHSRCSRDAHQAWLTQCVTCVSLWRVVQPTGCTHLHDHAAPHMVPHLNPSPPRPPSPSPQAPHQAKNETPTWVMVFTCPLHNGHRPRSRAPRAQSSQNP